MECPECRGPMSKGTAPVDMHRKGYHVFWEAVPAWACAQCGEAIFEGGEVDSLQNALRLLDAMRNE